MAEKVFVKNFEQFKGLDYKKSSLMGDVFDATMLTNYQFGETYSLRGRNGKQLIGQPGGFVASSCYSFYDTSTGATTQQQIALNDVLWRLTSTNLVITRTGGSTTWGYRVYFDTATATYKFELTQNSVQVLLQDLGNGLELAPYTILDLRDTIDALANFSCAMPTKTARVNGAQSGVTSITVDAGHTFATFDQCSVWDFESTQNYLKSFELTGTTATTVTWNSAYGNVNVVDNQVLGLGAVPAASVALRPYSSTATDPTANVEYFYWEKVKFSSNVVDPSTAAKDTLQPFAVYFGNRFNVNFKPATFQNANNSIYIGTDCLAEANTVDYDLEQQVYKYDGNACYRAGMAMPEADNWSLVSAGGAIPVGTYKYKYTYVFTDKNGIEIESDAGEEKSITLGIASDVTVTNIGGPDFPAKGAIVNGNQVGVTTIVVTPQDSIVAGDLVYIINRATGLVVARTVTTANLLSIVISGAVITVNSGDFIFVNYRSGFYFKTAIVNGTQTNVSSITVDAGHDIRSGDILYFYDSTDYVEYKRAVSSFTATTITLTGGTVSVTDNNVLSTIATRIYRTKVGGRVFYLNIILPVSPATLTSYLDKIADTDLREEYIPPDIGLERDPPPKASLITLHQGLMVYAGIKDQPNTIGYSNEDGLEYVALASNYFDIPSNIMGSLSAITSDSDDRLAAFKPQAYYDIAGDLSSQAFSVRSVREGDYGISHQSSIAKVDGVIIGLGPLGFVGVKDGDLSKKLAEPITPVFWNNTDLNLIQSVAINDPSTRQYHCYTPDIYGYASGLSQSYDTMYSFDYHNFGIWFDKDFNASLAPSGGMFYCNGELYQINRNYGGSLAAKYPGQCFVDRIGHYADNHLAVTYDIFTGFDPMGEPSIYKEYLWFSVYSFLGPFETGVAWDALVRTYKGFDSNNIHSQSVLSFSGVSAQKQRFKLKADKTEAMAYRITTNTLGQCPYLTGFEIIVVGSYLKDSPSR